VAVKLTILGSGSAGNCAYVETDETRLLVDAGFSPRQIRLRLASIGRAPENLSAILITHEHTDHICGLAGLADKLRIPIYCNRDTRDEIQRLLGLQAEFNIFATGAGFEIGDVAVETFAVPHDAQDPAGFLLRTPAGRIGFATDLGHFTRLVGERVRHANALVLESNHDVKLLQDCPRRPWSLKQRILGRHGHLSNDACADALEDIMTGSLRHVFLGHLSRDCNKPEIAFRTARQRLERIGATHVRLELTSQNVPCPTLTL
jgi:phosphoribosyl 1,2-cyclic phosphodiesterase